MNDTCSCGPDGQQTVFREAGNRAWLSKLCGLTCGKFGEDTDLSDVRGPAILRTGAGRQQLSATGTSFEQDVARISWQTSDGDLRLDCNWSVHPQTGVVSRRDRLTNKHDRPITLYRCQARLVFPPGQWEVYAQQSQWCNENQGTWLALHTGSLKFGCLPGRTTEGGAPYCCLRELGTGAALAFHILPQGNWSIEVRARPVQNDLPYAVVSLGMADDDLHLELAPGASLELPEILFQALPSGEPHLSAHVLHQYTQADLMPSGRPELPMVYNTWFDQFQVLEPSRLREQLAVASQIGCEIFVIDDGWYGTGVDGSASEAENLWLQTGDWHEQRIGAFRGEMKTFADEVRAAGLGFGLWMEPERFGPKAPVWKEHPDWFLSEEAPFARIDLQNPAACAYIRNEISRLVETYELAWMKVDFNFRLGTDATGAELSGYYEAWYRLLDEIRAEYPDTVFEGCASGGMRFDLSTLAHFDAHFLSDTVHPVDVLRIWQGALLRFPPGAIIKWLVLRSIERTIPAFTKSVAASPVTVATPCGALWEPSETVDIDFAAAAALPGMFGLSGDLASLPPEARRRLAEHVAFFKRWRKVIHGSVAHLLTPPRPKKDRSGWAAVQLLHQACQTSITSVYRLDDGSSSKTFRLRGLEPEENYQVSAHIPAGQTPRQYRGHELLEQGLQVDLPTRYRAGVFVIEKNKEHQ